jgi:AcrR family transcriptional regulator
MTSQPGRKELSHERILEAASRAIRRSGYDGVGVADIMKEAGLTHGGFYAHFASRDAMLAQALGRAGSDSAAVIAQRIARRRNTGASELRAFIEAYLSEAHLVSPTGGCPVAALVSETPRQSGEVQSAARERVDGLLERVRQALPAHAAPDSAAVIVSTLVGTLQLARVFGNNAQGKALLTASRKALIARYDTARGRTMSH